MRTPRTPRLLALGLLLSSLAFAQSDADKATARTLGQEGQAALDARDFARALDLFDRADRLFHAPTLLLGRARALAGVGRWVEAQEAYIRLVREGVSAGAPDVFKRAVDDAKRELAALEPRIPSLIVTVTGPIEPSVTVDGSSLPAAALGVRRAIDPGTHEIVATAAGWKQARMKVEVREGQAPKVELKLDKDAVTAVTSPPPASSAPPPASSAAPPTSGAPPAPAEPSAPPRPSRTSAYAALGVGVVGVLAGAVFGLSARSKHGELVDKCPGGRCPDDAQTLHDDYKQAGLFSTIGFGVGVVGLGAGAALLWTARPGTTTAVRVGPTGAEIAGRF